MKISKYNPELTISAPVSGLGTALVAGAALKRGATPATENGMLIAATASAAHPDTFGILREAHAVADDTDLPGTIFKTHPVELFNPGRVVRIRYSVLTADIISASEAVTTTTFTLTSVEDDIDAGFWYVVSGAGIGQTNFIVGSNSTTTTLKAAFTTNLDTTSRLIKILPRFHLFGALNADGTALRSQRGVGAWPIVVLDSYIIRPDHEKQLNPVNDSALTGLDSGSVIRFEADILVRNAIPYSID
mgnify:CR=1 FL=1